jgi:hypothetical protein
MKNLKKGIALAVLGGAGIVLPLIGAGSANAVVAVDSNGTGTVAKGDVQRVLGWNNAAFDKNVEPNGKDVTFARTYTRTTDNVWSCTNGVGEQHAYRVTVMNQPINATQVLNANGKQVTGWALSGAAPAPYRVLSDSGIPAHALACPAGSSLDFTKPFSINQIGVAKYNTYAYGDLTVNDVALPNTPVPAV